MQFSIDAVQIGEYDVIVTGGGPAGTGAAVAAARDGARTLLVESTGCLGGMGTAGMVAMFLGGLKERRAKGFHPAVGGVYRELIDRLAGDEEACGEGEAFSDLIELAFWKDHVIFDVEACRRHLDAIVLDAGVDLLLFTSAMHPQVVDGRIQGVFLFNKAGVSYAGTKMLVDCTGDADMAHRAGFDTVKGRRDTGLMTPATITHHWENVDTAALAKSVADHGDKRFRWLVKDMRAKGLWRWDEDIAIFFPSLREGVVYENTRRYIDVDGTDPRDLTETIIRGRRDGWDYLETVLRPHVPGFATARLRRTPELVGIRETRKIVGEYTLTEKDCIDATHFHDTIALTGYGWDLPDPKKPSVQPFQSKNDGVDVVIGKPFTEIPYRCLVPRGSENLLVAGRCISVEGQALGPVRVMAPCFAMGEAAGTAAALSAARPCSVRELSVADVQERLIERGAVLR